MGNNLFIVLGVIKHRESFIRMFVKELVDETYHILDVEIEETDPEHARGVLTLDLACEIVISANFREWRHILKMRKSKKAHPQMIEIMNTIHDILTSNIKVLFDNIEGVDNEQ